MYLISVLSLCLVVILLVSTRADEDIDIIPNFDVFITNGTKAEPQSAPFMAFLLIKKHIKLPSLCGGVLVSENYVLTAGHCVNNATSINVFLGVHNISFKTEYQIKVPAESWIAPADFKIDDLAAIKLKNSITYTKGVQPASLPRRSDADRDYVGQTGRVYGWGSTESGEVSHVLLYADMPIVQNTECKQPNNFICAAKIHKTGTCSGDSGGPLVVDDKVVGLVHGSKCEKGDLVYPSVFTKLNHYLDWIEENTDVLLE